QSASVLQPPSTVAALHLPSLQCSEMQSAFFVHASPSGFFFLSGSGQKWMRSTVSPANTTTPPTTAQIQSMLFARCASVTMTGGPTSDSLLGSSTLAATGFHEYSMAGVPAGIVIFTVKVTLALVSRVFSPSTANQSAFVGSLVDTEPRTLTRWSRRFLTVNVVCPVCGPPALGESAIRFWATVTSKLAMVPQWVGWSALMRLGASLSFVKMK